MLKQIKLFPVCLTVHDGAAAAATGAAPAAEAGTTAQPAVGQQAKPGETAKPTVIYGKQPTDTAPAAEEKPAEPAQPVAKTPEQRKSEFDALIKGEYKDLYTESFQQTFNRRFAETKAMEDQLKAYAPLTDLLATVYNVSEKDPAKLLKAVQNDSKMFESLADAAGIPVDKYKDMLKLQLENKAVKADSEAIRAEQQRIQRNAELKRQESTLQGTYPSFNMAAEITNDATGERFARMLEAGIDAKTAFEAVHFEEIMSGVISAAGKRAEENVTANIQAKGQRPREAGAASTPGVIVKNDPSQMSKTDRAEIARRVARGEKITF